MCIVIIMLGHTNLHAMHTRVIQGVYWPLSRFLPSVCSVSLFAIAGTGLAGGTLRVMCLSWAISMEQPCKG